jgi:chlorite dismutase
MSNRLFTFSGGPAGSWRVRSQLPYIGQPLSTVSFVSVINGNAPTPAPAPASGWTLRGITSNDRYVVRTEKQELVSKQQGLGRPSATYAALIPIRKTASWWLLTQDERRAIFEEQSQHMRIGMKYLPPIARRLHHCRDLAEPEAFDFLTWFEYDPAHESAFEELLVELRASEEWKYVDHEVDIRLVNSAA